MKLLEPLDFGFLKLRNRVVMGSMHTGLEGSHHHAKRFAKYLKDRAKGEVGLIITGGYSPNRRGWLLPFASKLSSQSEAAHHQQLTQAVHDEGGSIALQILHAGRYSAHPFCVAPSPIKSAISPFKPWEMSPSTILSTINDFAVTAELARTAGYNGIEVMGSEGYLLNQFFSPRTNHRKDDWGGSLENRMRLPLEIVKSIRKKTGPDFLIIFRISLLDLVENGATFDEVVTFAKSLEQSGVNALSTGIGWHESRVPTIATDVPRAAFSWVTGQLKQHVSVPVIAANRINTPEVAEKILQNNEADLVSMARPLLADPEFVLKVRQKRTSEINTCIACNQACLDHVFKRQIASCLVNPRACYEDEMPINPTLKPKKIAVVGAGPAGMSFSITAAQRGHTVTLFEGQNTIGGQFNLASKIPGKEEFSETLRYYKNQIELYKVTLKLNFKVTPDDLKDFDEIVIATGVLPRKLSIPGIENSMVVTYPDLINGKVPVKNRVAIIGAGGIGFDTAKFVSHSANSDFYQTWGIDKSLSSKGSLLEKRPLMTPKEIFLLQRKNEGFGKTLGKTTGWIHRLQLKDQKVKMLSGVEYLKIDDQGLHISQHKKEMILAVDQIVICAGQTSSQSLFQELSLKVDCPIYVIGGALKASEIDAKAAIREGVTLGLKI